MQRFDIFLKEQIQDPKHKEGFEKEKRILLEEMRKENMGNAEVRPRTTEVNGGVAPYWGSPDFHKENNRFIQQK
jgi:hypothetical protein